MYAKAYRGGAARMYCCFDVPRLRAPITFSVRAPAGWSCLSNAAAVSRPPGDGTGTWRFAPTAPIAPAVSSICAGPYVGASLSCEREAGPELPVSVLAMPSASGQLQPRRVLGLVREPLRYYERNLGLPFPYGKCDVLFVPGFPGLAFSAPGLIAIKEEALSQARPGERSLYLATGHRARTVACLDRRAGQHLPRRANRDVARRGASYVCQQVGADGDHSGSHTVGGWRNGATRPRLRGKRSDHPATGTAHRPRCRISRAGQLPAPTQP